MAPSNSKASENLSTNNKAPLSTLMSKFALILLAAYQLLLSPLLGPRCRFYPSCSNYAKQAINQYGFWHGFKLTLIRLSKCHPFNQGGIDELPVDNKPASCTHSH